MWFHNFQTYGVGVIEYWVIFVMGNPAKTKNQIFREI
jgi:hypothetical protein